ncbi:radical SAM protein [Oligoflexia bacterium]|nr:radical SAM protein [Oligoflexia bacterium]
MKIAKQIKIVLGYDCPHKCSYCYQVKPAAATSSVKTPVKDRLKSSPEKVEQIVAVCAENGATDLSFTGGEPLRYRDLLYAGIQVAYQWNCFASINTNLIGLREDDLLRFKEAEIVGLFTSMPNFVKEKYNAITGTNNYDKFLTALTLCRQHNLNTSINMVVSKLNWQDVYDTGRRLHEEFGIINFSASPIYATSRNHLEYMLTAEEIETVFDMLMQLRDQHRMHVTTLRSMVPCFSSTPEKYTQFTRGCGIVRTELTVLSDGTVRACDAITSSFGNALKEPLVDIVARMDDFLPYGSGQLYKVAPDGCHSCAELIRCRGGCRSEANAINGSLSSPNPYYTKPLQNKIFPDYVDLPDYSVGKIRLNIADDILDDIHAANTPVVRTELTSEERSLLALLSTESDERNIVDPNKFRIKHRLANDLFSAFLEKMSRKHLIEKADDVGAWN